MNDVTISWNLITDSELAMHISGATSRRDNISVHHNVYARNNERQPKIVNENEIIDLVNNVVYGWGGFAGGAKGLHIGDNVNVPNSDYPTLNVENNVFHYVGGLIGADINYGLLRDNKEGKIYFNGNIFPAVENENYSTSTRHVVPPYAQVTMYDANTLEDTVVPFAGTHYPTQEEKDLLNEISLALVG